MYFRAILNIQILIGENWNGDNINRPSDRKFPRSSIRLKLLKPVNMDSKRFQPIRNLEEYSSYDNLDLRFLNVESNKDRYQDLSVNVIYLPIRTFISF